MAIRSIVLIAGASVAAAVPGVGVLQWFSGSSCSDSTGSRSVFAGGSGFCHTVPAAPSGGANGGFLVTCNPFNTGGVFSTWNDDACSASLSSSTPFANDQCLDNIPGYGAQTFKPHCYANASEAAGAVSPLTSLPAGYSAAVFFSSMEACSNFTTSPTIANGSSVSAVFTPSGYCALVPSVPTTHGFEVTCAASGNSGSYCVSDNSTTCNTCTSTLPFNTFNCYANPASSGSSAVAFLCATPAPSGPNSTSSAPLTTSLTAGAAAVATLAAIVAALAF